MSILDRLKDKKRDIPTADVTKKETASEESSIQEQLTPTKNYFQLKQNEKFIQNVIYLHRRLINESNLDLKDKNVVNLSKAEKERFKRKIEKEILGFLAEEKTFISREEKTRIVEAVIDETLGLGPLQALVDADNISEIMINGPKQVYIEKKGKLMQSDIIFYDDAHLKKIIDTIVSKVGRKIDENCPLVDARLPDGSRFNAIIPPLALKGCTVTIRKFSKEPYKINNLINFGSLSPRIANFLEACVKGQINTIISGGTGSGKTTLLNVLSGYIPNNERIITVEDAAELQLAQEHVISLESRPANIEGQGAITIRDLVKNALRMRPNRIVVGECRSGEALDMLQAMNTGHDGSLTTGHANSPQDILTRLETMVLMSGMDLPVRAIREQISSAISLVVHQSRLYDGSRKIMFISEVLGIDNYGDIEIEDIFKFEQKGVDENNNIYGEFIPTGYVPSFLEKLKTFGIIIPSEMFDPKIKGEVKVDYKVREKDIPKEKFSPTDVQLMDTAIQIHQKIIELANSPTQEADQYKNLDKLPNEKVKIIIERTMHLISREGKLKIPHSKTDRDNILNIIINEIKGYGPITILIDDDSIDEIFVNGPKNIYTKSHGDLIKTKYFFINDDHIKRIISKVVSPFGRRCDESCPRVDARFPDGSGFNAVIPPLSLKGATITVRKFPKCPLTVDNLIELGSLDDKIKTFLEASVKGRLNIVIFGGTGSGKTTLLNVLSTHIPHDERIVTMEDAAELRLQQDHVVPLETRPPNIEGKGEITMQDLVKNALRMRPDRIIVGEIRGQEALDMLQAMNTGHDGSLSTGHANSPHDMLSRIETMVLMSGMDLPLKAIREQISSAIDMLVQETIMPDKSKKVVAISEVGEINRETGKINLHDIFVFESSGRTENGKIIGNFKATGYIPTFLHKIRLNGAEIDENIFKGGGK